MNNLRQYAGVTLLEIILVLAIAAMIMVLSIKYYESSSNSSMANALLQQIAEITSQADHLAAASGSYVTANVNMTTLASSLPANVFTTPWGSTLNVGPMSAIRLLFKISNTPTAVCTQLMSKFSANNHFQPYTPATFTPSSCTAGMEVDVEYLLVP